MIHRTFLGFIASGLLLALLATGCGDDNDAAAGAGGEAGSGGAGGEGGSGFEPPEFGTWVKYEPEGAVCSDGSQYAFYVEFSETSDNVIVFFMGGGGCWDYESCVGGGARGAANPNGLPDDYANSHAEIVGLTINVNEIYPLMNDDPDVSPMADWNKVFVPYCTGDVYAGSVTNTYEDPEGVEEDAVFAHQGHTNVLKMTEMLNEMFRTVPKMFVGGCSAGGAGAIVNYYFLRTGIEGVQRGYLLDDSGPMYPSIEPTSRSNFLHQEVRDVWDAEALIAKAPQSGLLASDFGALSQVLAEEFPEDRLATTMFRFDYNFSLYSYERFWTRDEPDTVTPIVPYGADFGLGLDQDAWLDRGAVYELLWDDQALLREQYDAVSNLGYYMPFYRTTNDSHCVSVPGFEDVANVGEALDLFQNDFGALAWRGSEIGEMNLRDYVEHLLDDDQPLQSYLEQEGEGPYVPCTPGDYDVIACRDAVCERLDDQERLEQDCPVMP
ncbi:MAG: hypothetical protein JRE81_06460 [Deltaproteobacteria bacterium]|jgi:hypothetical protein|nr:hypothetical protein [Deltaproteobacteria bacterium]